MRRFEHSFLRHTLSLAILMAAQGPTPVAAQQGGVQAAPERPSLGSPVIDEIIVTAQKRAESLQEVPISLTAITAEDLEFRRIDEIGDLQFQVPGMNFGRDGGGGQQISMRGVGIDVFNSNIELPFAVYVDGVYQARSFRSPSLGLDLKQTEILRGPQGTLFGRNATSGALNILLQEPTDEPVGKARLGVGSFGKATAEAMVSGPIVPGLLGGRFAAEFGHYGGDVENLFREGEGPKYINGLINGAGRGILTYRAPTQWLTGDVSFFYSRAEGGALAPPLVCIAPSDPELEARTTSAPPSSTTPELFHCSWDPHKIKLNRENDGRSQDWQTALNLVADLGFASVKSITAFQDHGLFDNYDLDGSARDSGYFRDRHDFSRALTQEINVLGSNPWFSWLTGAYFFRERYGSSWDPVLPGYAGGTGLLINLFGRERVTSTSVFGDATVFLPWNLNAFGGLRFTHDEKTTLQKLKAASGANPGGTLGVIPPYPLAAFGLPLASLDCTATYDDSFDNLSPRYGLQWNATQDINLYAKRSFGYNAGGHYPFVCNNPYEPETLDTIEVGGKSSWLDGALVANVSLFTSDFKDFQIFKVVENVATLAINAPVSKARGIELELVARPFERLTANAGVSLLDAYFEEFEDTDQANPDAGVQDLSGNELNRSPNYTVALGMEYAWPLATQWLIPSALANSLLRFRGDWFLTDDVVMRPFEGEFDKQPGYNILNLIAGATSPGESVQFQLFAKNVTNTKYFGYILGFPSGSFSGVPGGPPRSLGLEMTYLF